jgi:hypothetical protein
MLVVAANVRYSRNSGQHLLAMSLSGFDPEPTFQLWITGSMLSPHFGACPASSRSGIAVMIAPDLKLFPRWNAAAC